MQFDQVTVAALQASLTARALVGQLQLTQQTSTISFIANRVPGAEIARPKGPGPWVMLSVQAIYRSPDKAIPIPSTPGAPQHFDRSGGIQRSYGPQRLFGTSRILDPLVLSIVCDSEPGAILVATGLLLDFLRTLFDLQDARSNEGKAPVRFP